MFTGIIECVGAIVKMENHFGNIHLWVKSSIAGDLKVDQSLAHEGVCLTVVGLKGDMHEVTAIAETQQKTTLAYWQIGQKINLERCLKADGRFDGHIVQGHVDQTGICTEVVEVEGSWLFTFEYKPIRENLVVEKGSITVNGTSLTAFRATENSFQVAIIPYTYQHTSIALVKAGMKVNLEFDVIGKYVARLLSGRF